jgi:hypothetical protein
VWYHCLLNRHTTLNDLFWQKLQSVMIQVVKGSLRLYLPTKDTFSDIRFDQGQIINCQEIFTNSSRCGSKLRCSLWMLLRLRFNRCKLWFESTSLAQLAFMRYRSGIIRFCWSRRQFGYYQLIVIIINLYCLSDWVVAFDWPLTQSPFSLTQFGCLLSYSSWLRWYRLIRWLHKIRWHIR